MNFIFNRISLGFCAILMTLAGSQAFSSAARPTISLTANGLTGDQIFVVGTSLTRKWTTTDATSLSSYYTEDGGTTHYPWSANTLQGSVGPTTNIGQAGHVYHVTLTAKGPGGTTTLTDSYKIVASSTAPSPSPLPSPPPRNPASDIQTGSHVEMDNVEVLSPFLSWANAKTIYRAQGDGKTNDSPALQAALDDLGRVGKEGVLYLPPGTYILKSTITYNAVPQYIVPPVVPGMSQQPAGNFGVRIVGDSPSTTILKWEGPAGEPMIIQNGGYGISYSRMTLDGQGTAGYGIAQWWDTTSKTYQATFSEHVDMVFQDMGIGIMGGQESSGYGQLDSEGQVRRVTFLRMKYAGLDLGSFNADDWWIFDSQFIDCARGVTSDFSLCTPDLKTKTCLSGTTNGAGGFYVYRSLFLNSSIADISFDNTKWFSMYDNVSIGSAQFFVSGDTSAPAEVIMKGNRIINTTNSVSIYNGNIGPLILIDNEIRSSNPTDTPVESSNINFGVPSNVFSTGNQYTVPPGNFIKHKPSDRIVSMGDTQVAASSISTCQPNTTTVQSQCAPLTILPATPSLVTREVFEVPAGASGPQIQDAINAAAKAANAGVDNPVVHLPPGQYQIYQTLVIPAQTRMQISGDSSTTEINWLGPKGGSIFQLNGPSYATLRNMYLFDNFQTNLANAITITQADQPGGRIFLEGNVLTGLTASSLSQTQITGQENTNNKFVTLTDVANVSLVANGGVGPLTETNSSITIVDTWWEGTLSELYYKPNGGSITLAGADLNPASHTDPVLPIEPALDLDGFSGLFSLIGVQIRESSEPNGITIEIDSENPNTNAMVLGCDPSDYYLATGELFSGINQTSSGGNVGVISSVAFNKSGPQLINDQGPQSLSFVNKMLGQLRALTWDNEPYFPPAGATDVRIYRVDMGATTGLVVTGN